MRTDLTIGIVGSGGDGVIVLGELLARSSARAGLNTVLLKSFGPQIRGGESSCRVRVAQHPLHRAADSVDALLLLSLRELPKFAEELRAREDALLIADSDDDFPLADCPLTDAQRGSLLRMPLMQLGLTHGRSKQARNMVLAGAVLELLGWPQSAMEEYLRERFARHGEAVIGPSLAAIAAGREYAAEHFSRRPDLRIELPAEAAPLMLISGDDAFSLGALSAGCRFMAGYPISPASEILEWMSRELPAVGGVCVQAEDEISALSMAIGASYGGTRALTASSGPGFSLMLEALGLASMAELPLVICDVQRVGPSTGIPTRTEQADLASAIYGGHGDAGRVVLAATDIESCHELAHSAFEIAERFQTPVIVLLDQYLGQSVQSARLKLRDESGADWRRLATEDELGSHYRRFAQSPDGVSPMALPGMPGGEHLLVGLSHDEAGNPSSSQRVHQRLSEKRGRKLTAVAGQYRMLAQSGKDKPRLGLLTWGSSFGVCAEAAELLNKQGDSVGVLAPQVLVPLPEREITAWLAGLEELVIVELSFSAQFAAYLKSRLILPASLRILHRAGGSPVALDELQEFIAAR